MVYRRDTDKPTSTTSVCNDERIYELLSGSGCSYLYEGQYQKGFPVDGIVKGVPGIIHEDTTWSDGMITSDNLATFIASDLHDFGVRDHSGEV